MVFVLAVFVVVVIMIFVFGVFGGVGNNRGTNTMDCSGGLVRFHLGE
jgi:hypothetical protein